MKAKLVKQVLNEDYNDFENEEIVTDETERNEIIDEPPFLDEPFDEDEEINNMYNNEEITDDLVNTINNELTVPEYARREVNFRFKGQPGTIEAIPMAKMNNGKSYLMKINGKFQKINLDDIVEE
jgi:hypothetical protein